MIDIEVFCHKIAIKRGEARECTGGGRGYIRNARAPLVGDHAPHHQLRSIRSVDYALISETNEAYIGFDGFTLTFKTVYRCVFITIANGNTAKEDMRFI